jgi:hypothetical protein
MLAFAASASATAQDDPPAAGDYENQVRSYLEAGMAAHAEHGYSRDRGGAEVVVPLHLGSPYLWPVNLRAGVNYRVYGACDDDCSDLDMEIYGADGHLVDRDANTDDTPYVQITPTVSGRAYVRMWVYACRQEPCYSGARLVSGGTPVVREQAADPEEQTDGDDESDSDADNEYISTVHAELDRAGARHVQAGYAIFGEDLIEPVDLEGNGLITTIHLDANYDYIFQGACDQDCSDADMEVRDASGAQLALDVDADDRPSVAVTPARTGNYGLRIWLAACEQEPCYVGVRSYRRRR